MIVGTFAWLWGAPAYVTSIANLVPQVELDFFGHLERGEIEAARNIVVEYETPFFEAIGPYGWHEGLHAALKVFGLPAGGLRLPLVAPPASYERSLETRFKEIGLLK